MLIEKFYFQNFNENNLIIKLSLSRFHWLGQQQIIVAPKFRWIKNLGITNLRKFFF